MASSLFRLRRCGGVGAALVTLVGAVAACSGSSHTASKPAVTTHPPVVTSRPDAGTTAPATSSFTTSSSSTTTTSTTTTSLRRARSASTSSSVFTTTTPLPGATTALVQNSQPTPPPGAPPTTAASVDMASPNAVAVAAIKALWTVNAAKDETPFAAEVRATVYMTPSYAAEIKGNPPQAAPGAQWQLWVDHHVVTSVKVVREYDAGGPVSTASTAYLQYGVTVVPRGTHGWKGADNTYTEFVELTRASSNAPWLVATVDTSA